MWKFWSCNWCVIWEKWQQRTSTLYRFRPTPKRIQRIGIPQAHLSQKTRQEITSSFPLFSTPYTFLSLASRPFLFYFLPYTHRHTHTQEDKSLYSLFPFARQSPTPSPGSLAPDDALINWLGAGVWLARRWYYANTRTLLFFILFFSPQQMQMQ